MNDRFSEFPWLKPWQAISQRGREAYLHELRLEVTPGHPLFGVPVTPVARCCDTDDILFELHNHPAEFAVVHMTFIGAPESKPHWPVITLYSDLDHWVAKRMMPDVAYFEAHGIRKAA